MTKMISYRPDVAEMPEAEKAEAPAPAEAPANGNGTGYRIATPVSKANGTAAVQRRLARRVVAASPSPRPDYRTEAEGRPALAVFCFDPLDSFIGAHVASVVTAVAKRRQAAVHLFTRHAFEFDDANVTVHDVGGSDEGTVLDQARDFGSRASNAFLREFPVGPADVGLIGYEWTAIPALSLLRGIKHADFVLALHSLERRRSDMTGELSKRIEDIELSGLREARAVLVHEPATGEVARYWAPDCADRLVPARPLFPMAQFQSNLDPGAVKARYQVGPVDPTILYVGDLSERYGPDLLVKAMPAILKHNKQARLVVVGDGDLYWPLRVYARYLLLEHAVRLVGSVVGQPLYELIQAADVVCVPSRESTPWWPIQAAWAAKRPVAATHEAARGLVEHERDSVLFYPNENSCVWGVERILCDPEFGRGIAARGRQKLEDRFGWNCLAEQIEELAGVAAGK